MTGESNNFKDPIEIKGGGVPLDIVLGSSIGSVIFVLVLAIVLFLIWKKRNPPYTQVVRLENGQGISPIFRLYYYEKYNLSKQTPFPMLNIL